MAKLTGKDLYVAFGGSDISGLYRSVAVTEDADLVDVTSGSETVHSYLFTRADGNLEFEGLYNYGGSGQRALMDPGDSGTLSIGPAGSGSDAEKWQTSTAFVRTRRVDYPYDGEIRYRVTFQFSAAWAESTFVPA